MATAADYEKKLGEGDNIQYSYTLSDSIQGQSWQPEITTKYHPQV